MLRLFFEQANDGMVLADIATQKIINANAAFCRMLGIPPDEIRHLSIRKLHPADALPHVIAHFERLASGSGNPPGTSPCCGGTAASSSRTSARPS